MGGYLKGILAFVSLGGLVSGGWLLAQNASVKNIVLVHGAFADGSNWSKVIPLLQAKGLHVTSVGTPLTSFADDVAATKRAIAAEDGPVILVGHSYGGVVITEAGNDPKGATPKATMDKYLRQDRLERGAAKGFVRRNVYLWKAASS